MIRARDIERGAMQSNSGQTVKDIVSSPVGRLALFVEAPPLSWALSRTA